AIACLHTFIGLGTGHTRRLDLCAKIIHIAQLFSHECGTLIAGYGIHDFRRQRGGVTGNPAMRYPLVLAIPSSGGDQYAQFDHLATQACVEAQMLPHTLQASGQLGIVQQGDKGPLYLASRASGYFSGDFTLPVGHSLWSNPWKTLAHTLLLKLI